jgi:hypothetical protein
LFMVNPLFADETLVMLKPWAIVTATD